MEEDKTTNAHRQPIEPATTLHQSVLVWIVDREHDAGCGELGDGALQGARGEVAAGWEEFVGARPSYRLGKVRTGNVHIGGKVVADGSIFSHLHVREAIA